MSIVRTALPLVLLTSVLTGCAGLQKTDWPTCAAVGGVVGAGLGAVGGGLSGLSAAWFYRDKHPNARILILENHDDFGGHAKRNEFQAGGRMIIGYGGSTGRSTGPHLHFETRYCGQSFDPERLIDFKNGTLSRETFLLKKSFFSIYSNAGQDFEDEIANEEQDKKEAAEKAAMKYYKIRSGDTLGGIARRYGTTVTNICRLNGIKSTTVLRIGRSLRVR